MSSTSAPLRPAVVKPRKGRAFWLSFVALIASILLSALDLTAVSTALPTITNDLHGGDKYVWVGSAYGLSSTAVLPLSGSLADIFGMLFLFCNFYSSIMPTLLRKETDYANFDHLLLRWECAGGSLSKYEYDDSCP
jgi:hypothetical protein